MHSTPPTICSTCLVYLPQLVQQKPANISITSLLSIADSKSLSLLFTYHPYAHIHLFYPYLTVFHYSISMYYEEETELQLEASISPTLEIRDL
jgi:hypothetical protein